MDIFAHGLWAGAGAKALNKRKNARKVNIWAMVLWGMFPDLFAFTIPFIWLLGGFVFGGFHLSQFSAYHPHVAEPTNASFFWPLQISNSLYNISHSLIIFSIVFLGVWAYFKQARLELLGWLLHILMDVPTHTYAFFPTPIFWPLFGWKFNGISWAVPWFMVLNYSLILLVYALLSRKKKIDNKA
jgi:hypothetical protein